MNVAVFGAGYVGAVTAAGLAAHGHEVAIRDVRMERVRALLDGDPDIDEPGIRELVEAARGRLRAGVSAADALAGADVALVCVGTPSAPDGRIDLTNVRDCVREIAGSAQGPLVVTLRSTVVPGTTDALDREILAAARARGIQLMAAANPEFLREGRAVDDFMHPDRVVVGTSSPQARAILTDLYSFASGRVLAMTAASAELAKYANNALLAMLVSISNELAELAERTAGADVIDSIRAVHADRRWREDEGRWSPAVLSYLWPGCGYGGSCLPKDVKALAAAGTDAGLEMPLVHAIDETNERQADRLAVRIAEHLGLKDPRVAVLGTAFKAATTDTRTSPGLALARALRERGVSVVTYDPAVRGRDDAPDLDAALRDTAAWVVVTWAPEFADLPRRAAESGKILVDARRRFERPGKAYLGTGLSA